MRRGLELLVELVDQLLLLSAVHFLTPPTAWPSTEARSTRTPGPIVDERAIDFTYLPFAAAGFALITVSIRVFAFSRSLSGAERDLADRGVDDRRLVDAELDLAGLDLLHRLADVERHRARLRVRHEAARAEHLPEPSDRLHHVGRGDHGVEVEPALLDLRDHVVAAHEVGAGVLRLLELLARGDHQDLLALPAEPVRQHHGAAHHLVGVLGVDAEAHRDLDRLVELREGALRDHRDGLGQRVRRLRPRPPPWPFDTSSRLGPSLSFRALLGAATSSPGTRAVPRTPRGLPDESGAPASPLPVVTPGGRAAPALTSSRPRRPCCGRCRAPSGPPPAGPRR